MKWLGWLFQFAKGLFPGGSQWLVDIADGLTRGTIHQIVEEKNKPRGVRVYGATPERIADAKQKVQRYREARAERDHLESGQ